MSEGTERRHMSYRMEVALHALQYMATRPLCDVHLISKSRLNEYSPASYLHWISDMDGN